MNTTQEMTLGSVRMQGNTKVVIGGSYRRHLPRMYALKNFLQKVGVEVLAPVDGGIRDCVEEFVLLHDDVTDDPRLLQDSIFTKMRKSTFYIAYNQDGYLGKAVVFEMGYAIALGMQILTIAPVQDPNLLPYCKNLSDVFPQWTGK